MIDWRQGLEWVVLLVFILGLVLTFIIGILSGLKRTLYWTISNIIFWLLAMIFTLTLSGALATTLANSFGTTPELISSLKDIFNSFAGLIFFLICFVGGNLIIALPLYFAVFKKVLKIGPKYNDGEKLQLKSRLAAAPIALVLFLPQVSILTETSIAATTHFITSSNNGLQSVANNIYKITNWLNNYISFYIGDLYKNTNATIAVVNLTSGSDINDFGNSISTFSENLDNAAQTIQASEEFNVSDAKTISTAFNSYEGFANSLKFGELLDEICDSELGLKLLNDNIDSFSFSSQIHKSDYEFIAPFIQTFHDGMYIPACADTTSNLVSETIKMDTDTENKKIPIHQSTFIDLCDAFKYKILDQTEWTEPITALHATELFLGTFIFNVTDKNGIISSDNDNILSNPLLTSVVDINEIYLNIPGLIAKENEEIINVANGTENNPYIIPTNLFYQYDPDLQIYIKNQDLEFPLTFAIQNSLNDYITYQNLGNWTTQYTVEDPFGIGSYLNISSNESYSPCAIITQQEEDITQQQSTLIHDGEMYKVKMTFQSNTSANCRFSVYFAIADASINWI